MTEENAKNEFNRLIAKNGFKMAGQTSDPGNTIYHRMWLKQDEVLEVRILLSGIYPLVTVKRNGVVAGDIIRDYSSPKRAMIAIRGIVRRAGFDW